MNCPDCSGAMWDNRANKKNPRSPDFKCKNQSCGKGIWEDRQNGASAPTNGNGHGPAANGNAAPRPLGAPLGIVYAECMEFAAKSVRHYIGENATAQDIVAATATLFIQAAQSGRPIRAPKAAPPPRPVAPPPQPEPDPAYSGYDDPDALPF